MILFLFIVLYFRWKFNKQVKASKLASNQVQINYIRNQDIVNNEIVSVNDDIKSDNQVDDNILNHIKREINKIDHDGLKPINFSSEYSSY